MAWLPGARMRLTHGLAASPRSRAFLAVRPAATIIAGSVAVVQLVMAAMASAPWPTVWVEPSAQVTSQVRERSTPWPLAASSKRALRPAGVVRLCGRDGPASESSTWERSSSMTRA